MDLHAPISVHPNVVSQNCLLLPFGTLLLIADVLIHCCAQWPRMVCLTRTVSPALVWVEQVNDLNECNRRSKTPRKERISETYFMITYIYIYIYTRSEVLTKQN